MLNSDPPLTTSESLKMSREECRLPGRISLPGGRGGLLKSGWAKEAGSLPGGQSLLDEIWRG